MFDLVLLGARTASTHSRSTADGPAKDVAGLDIAAPASTRLEFEPVTPDAETGRLVEETGVRWSATTVDARDLDALRKAADRIGSGWGGIDMVFANAGIQAFTPLLDGHLGSGRPVHQHRGQCLRRGGGGDRQPRHAVGAP